MLLLRYNHAEFFERDLYVIFQTLGIPLLDFRMLYSRTDAHVGSQGERGGGYLHFCMPGPLKKRAMSYSESTSNHVVSSWTRRTHYLVSSSSQETKSDRCLTENENQYYKFTENA
jgi:hypothetical protein